MQEMKPLSVVRSDLSTYPLDPHHFWRHTGLIMTHQCKEMFLMKCMDRAVYFCKVSVTLSTKIALGVCGCWWLSGKMCLKYFLKNRQAREYGDSCTCTYAYVIVWIHFHRETHIKELSSQMGHCLMQCLYTTVNFWIATPLLVLAITSIVQCWRSILCRIQMSHQLLLVETCLVLHGAQYFTLYLVRNYTCFDVE